MATNASHVISLELNHDFITIRFSESAYTINPPDWSWDLENTIIPNFIIFEELSDDEIPKGAKFLTSGKEWFLVYCGSSCKYNNFTGYEDGYLTHETYSKIDLYQTGMYEYIFNLIDGHDFKVV